MANVTFEEEPRYAPRPATAAPEGSIIGLMYKLGFAKTQRDANVVLGGIIGVCVLVSATMFVLVQPHPHPESSDKFQQDLAHMRATTNTAPSVTQ